MSDVDGVRKIEYVPMDAIGRRTGYVLHALERRRVRGRNAEDVRPNQGRKQWKEIDEAADKSSRDEILTVLYSTE